MPELVSADTSCLIALSRIDGFGLLEGLYSSVWTTDAVAQEFGRPLPPWIEVRITSESMALRMLSFNVDRGEASAIALAIEHSGCTIILDDRKARVMADALGLKVTGTLGVIVKAKQSGVIPAAKPWIERLKQAGFRMSEAVERALLREAGEQP